MKLTATQLALLKKVSAELTEAGLDSAQLLSLEVYDGSVQTVAEDDENEDTLPELLEDFRGSWSDGESDAFIDDEALISIFALEQDIDFDMAKAIIESHF